MIARPTQACAQPLVKRQTVIACLFFISQRFKAGNKKSTALLRMSTRPALWSSPCPWRSPKGMRRGTPRPTAAPIQAWPTPQHIRSTWHMCCVLSAGGRCRQGGRKACQQGCSPSRYMACQRASVAGIGHSTLPTHQCNARSSFFGAASCKGENGYGSGTPSQNALSPQACYALGEGAVIVYGPACLAVATGVQHTFACTTTWRCWKYRSQYPAWWASASA